MLRFIGEFIDVPVMELRGGRRLSETLEAIIDPHKLKVIGFYVDDRAAGSDRILLVEDIRDIADDTGIIVDSEDVLTDPSDLVRLEDILDMGFEIRGKKLTTQSGKRLGKIDDYAIDDMSFRIEKLYGRPTAIKTLSTNDYIISRRQIASVNQNEVIVKDAAVKDGNRVSRPSLNPLRP